MKKNDLDKPEPLLINTEPVASNAMTSRALFFQRKLYDKVAFSSANISLNKPIDFWYEKTFYGRKDANLDTIHLSETRLKQIPIETPEPLFAVNFVVDAFMGMMEEMRYLKFRDVLVPDGPIYDMEPKAAWTSLHQIYHNIMSLYLYPEFLSFVDAEKYDKSIVDFKSFVNVFVRFVDEQTPRLCFTRSKTALMKNTTPLISGLSIEIFDGEYSEDEPKMEKFIQDPNFAIYKETAMRYGFMLDKHIPWRLVADIGSPALQKYMSNYGVNKNNFFQNYYYKSHLYDLDALKAYIIEFYNSYVSAKPVVAMPEFAVSKSGIEVLTKKIFRDITEQESLDKEIDEQYWLRMYTFIRAREENKPWNQVLFERAVRNAFYYYTKKSKRVALDFIKATCQTNSLSQEKQRDYSFINVASLI